MADHTQMFTVLLIVALGIVGFMLVANVNITGKSVDPVAQAEIALLKGKIANLEAKVDYIEQQNSNS